MFQPNQILLEGMTIELFLEKVREVVREEMKANEEVYELTKVQACKKLNISFPTLKKRLERENITKIFNTDLHRLQK